LTAGFDPGTHEPECNLGCTDTSHRLLSDREAEWFHARDEDERRVREEEAGHA
jgi:hypothetical protein